MLIKHLLSFICFFLLTGCAGLNKKFDCPTKLGVTCKSVNEVNALVDQGVLPHKDCLSNNCETIHQPYQKKQMNIKSEKVLTIWFAPFEENGIKHKDAYSNIVLSEREPK